MAYKKLKRSATNKIFGGVCGGLGQYFEIDPVIFRIIFLVLLFLAGGGFLLYVLLWILVPLENVTNTNKAYSTPPPRPNFSNASDDIHYEEMDNYNSNSNKKNSEDLKKKDDNKPAYVGALIMIIIGALLLFNNLIGWFNMREWWPILLIAFGIFLLITTVNKGDDNDKDKKSKKNDFNPNDMKNDHLNNNNDDNNDNTNI